MIKTIIDHNVDEFDKRVNEFIKTHCNGSAPVRDGTFIYPFNGVDTVFHKATIFFEPESKKLTKHEETIYDDENGHDTSKAIPEEETDNTLHRSNPAPKAKSGFNDESVGALWISKDDKVSGKIGNVQVNLGLSPEEIQEDIDNQGVAKVLINGEKYTLRENKFKKAWNHPDYKIYKR